jgi:hypothetical protein
VIDAFLAALRNGEVEGLVAVLDPDVVVRVDEAGHVQVRREKFVARNWA